MKNKGILKKLLLVFLVIQPILDFDVFYTEKVINFFNFSPSTIIRLVMVLLLTFIIIIDKSNVKKTKKLLLYTIIISIYTILHHINAYYLFNANITGTFDYNILVEIFYMIRMFVPILIIFITTNFNFTFKEIKQVFYRVTLIYSFIIVMSSIFKFGLQTYGYNSISYGLLDMFSIKNINIYDYATRGLFEGSNRTGILLSALFPLNLYFFVKDTKKTDILLIFLQMVSLVLIGTRVSIYCSIIVIFAFLLLYFACVLLKLETFKFRKTVLLIMLFIIGVILVVNSPIKNRKLGKDYVIDAEEIYEEEHLAQKLSNALLEKYNPEKQKEFIKENYSSFYIRSLYIENIYNYNYDPNFWISVMEIPFKQRNNDRKIQSLISNRILELNNNNADYFFGMGYSRFKSSNLYLERDFVAQFYTLGIMGLLIFIIIPYGIVLIKAIIFMMSNYKKNVSFELLIYCFSICMFIILSLFSGHILDEMITYIFIAFICGLILNKIRSKEEINIKKELVSVIIPIYNCEKYLKDCLNSIVKQTYGLEKLEIIMIDDGSKDRSLKICKTYAKKYNWILIHNLKNLGAANSRNLAIRKSSGKYICFLDSDDLLYPETIETLYSKIENEQADIVMSKLNSFDSNGYYGYYSDKYMAYEKEGNISENMELLNSISICSKLYKSDFIKNNNIEFLKETYHEDNSFSIVSYFLAKKIIVLPKYLYYRRLRDDSSSIMQNLNYNKFNDLIENYKFTLKKLSGRIISVKLYYLFVIKLNNYIVNNLDTKDYEKAHTKVNMFISNININSRRLILLFSNMYFKIIKVIRRAK